MGEAPTYRPIRESDRVTFLVDSSMYGESNATPIAVYGDLDRLVQSDLHYHYSGPICAHRWLDVCADPSYGHLNLISRVNEIFPSLIKAIRTDKNGSSRIALTSLGPGDGALDECMLRSLDAGAQLESYCGLDFSFDLLRRAVHRIDNAVGFRSEFPIRAVCGDFTNVPAGVLDGLADGCIRMFNLTGFTLGNYDERELLDNLSNLMTDSDYLFLDARLHALGSRAVGQNFTDAERCETLDSYDLSSVRRFVFGPIEVSTFASSDDVTISFDLIRGHTSVPNAINVAIYCTGLKTRMRLSGKAVHRDRLELAVTTLYNLEDLRTWFGTAGLATVWSQKVNGVAFFLLKKA